MKTKHLKNCHARGVDSVILEELSDGRLVRAFIARENHELYNTESFTVGFHPHRFDIELHVVEGEIYNVSLSNKREGHWEVESVLDAYLYQSPILEKKGGFQKTGKTLEAIVKYQRISVKEKLELEAKILHTIYIDQGKTATWIVTEGAKDESYVPVLYTNRDLSNEDSTGMYVEMTAEKSTYEIDRINKRRVL